MQDTRTWRWLPGLAASFSLAGGRSRAFAGAAVSALLVPSAAGAATNLLVDGSFQNGLTGWTLSGTESQGYPEVLIPFGVSAPYPKGAFGATVPTPKGSASPTPAGADGLYFVSDLANQTLSQTLRLGPGTYDVGLSLYIPQNGWNNSGNATIDATAGGVTLLSTTAHALTPNAWYNVTGSFTATAAGDYTMNFNFMTNHAPSADVVIDQLYVVAAPTQTTTVVVSPDEAPLPVLGATPLGLVALGAGLFAARRRNAAAGAH